MQLHQQRHHESSSQEPMTGMRLTQPVCGSMDGSPFLPCSSGGRPVRQQLQAAAAALCCPYPSCQGCAPAQTAVPAACPVWPCSCCDVARRALHHGSELVQHLLHCLRAMQLRLLVSPADCCRSAGRLTDKQILAPAESDPAASMQEFSSYSVRAAWCTACIWRVANMPCAAEVQMHHVGSADVRTPQPRLSTSWCSVNVCGLNAMRTTCASPAGTAPAPCCTVK
jgi:hypothetical protein